MRQNCLKKGMEKPSGPEAALELAERIISKISSSERGIINPSFSSLEICSWGDQKVEANLKTTSGLADRRVEKKRTTCCIIAG